MNNILHNISGKIEPFFVDALSELKKVADSLDIPFFIVGATARDFILEHCYNVKSPRMTKDIDLGVKVPDWNKFTILSDALLANGKFLKAKEKQRYIYKNVLIDIVPFGDIAGKEKKIKWPPEDEIVMSILGFEEAYRNAVTIRLNNDPILDIKVPTIPGLAIMKLISWHENYPERKKDAEDFLFLIKNYEYAEIEDRLYEKEISLLEDENFDNQFAGIRLLGKDMVKISTPETLKKIKEILDNETGVKTNYRLITHIVSIHDDFDKVFSFLNKLKQGILEEVKN